MTIGAFAAEAGVNVETVRYYQRKGLLRQPAKPRGGIRRYGEADVARVQFVKAAQRLAAWTKSRACALMTVRTAARHASWPSASCSRCATSWEHCSGSRRCWVVWCWTAAGAAAPSLAR